MRLAAMTVGLLLATVGAGSRAAAAVGCDAKSAGHIASTHCVEHRRTRVHTASKTQETVSTTAAAMVSEGDELTPLSAGGSSSKAVAARPHATSTVTLAALSASSVADRLGRAGEGPSPWRGHGAPAGNRWPTSFDMPVPAHAAVTADASQGSPTSPGDLVRGGMPNVPAPTAWAILLMGLLGLTAFARQPRVARVQSWVMTLPSSSAARSSAGVRAVDRVDPTRYVQGPARRSHQGHFVRSSATSTGFGVGA